MTLITNWNLTISETDQVTFLGDLCMIQGEADALEQLQDLTYESLVFIEGNHDSVSETFDSTLPTRQYHYLEHND